LYTKLLEGKEGDRNLVLLPLDNFLSNFLNIQTSSKRS